MNCYMESEDDEKVLRWTLQDQGGIAYFGFAYYNLNSATLTVARIADDEVKGDLPIRAGGHAACDTGA